MSDNQYYRKSGPTSSIFQFSGFSQVGRVSDVGTHCSLTTDLPPLPSPHSNLLISFSPVPWLYALLTDLFVLIPTTTAAAAAVAAKLLQSCLTLCNPLDGSLPGSPIPGIL